MAITLSTPTVDQAPAALDALRSWQREGTTMQLHPGDIGWHWQFGGTETAAALRVWSRDDQVVAVGMLDAAKPSDQSLIRMAVDPDAAHDDDLAQAIAGDLADPSRGVLSAGRVAVEMHGAYAARALLADAGWQLDDPWTQLRFDLTDPVSQDLLRIETVGPDQLADRIKVHHSSFKNSTFDERRWHSMESGPEYAHAQSLIGYDPSGAGLAMITVWSAGEGRPGLVEPMGVHASGRGHGYGRAICHAGMAALRSVGATSALVATPTANVGGVAAYESAGFVALPLVHDLYRAS